MAKRGRKPQGEYVGKSEVMGFRVTPDTKAALEKASRESGRSISQEIEHRLRRDLFQHGSADTYAVMRTISYAIDELRNIKNPKAHWLDDPYLFAQARQAMIAFFDLLAPDPGPSVEETIDQGPQKQGLVAVHELLREIQITDETKPRVRQTPRERALWILKTDLNTLAERPHPYGKTATQLREEAKEEPARRKFIAEEQEKVAKHKRGKS